MNLFSDSFLSPSYEATSNNQYQYLSLRLQNIERDDSFFQVDSEGALAFGAPLLSYLKINEFYFQFPTGENQKVSLGRHKINWSGLDRRWNFGVWEPVFKVNPLVAESQGLVGVFWEKENPWSAITFFASPVYLPNQGPSFDIDSNGQFVKGNPWFQRPPDSIRILKEVSSVEYNFEKPSETSVVLQSTYSARARLHNEKGSLIQLSYAYKPMNVLGLSYDGVLDISKDRGAVTIQPNVYYHNVYGADIVWSLNWFHMGASALSDVPQRPPAIDSHWNYPIMDPGQLFSGFFDFDFKLVQLSLERIQVFNGDVHEVGELASANRPSITSRYPYTQANRITLKNLTMLSRGKKLGSMVSWTQSELNQFQMLRLKSTIQFSSLWAAFADLQLIQADDNSVKNYNEISQYANNDRISVGVSYVF